ncbi:MAG: 2-succinyl-5-enolpyruvyl-6-hydroxy-3-cyclohexene-1-carboxylic-acid synthase, partial [Actinomycetota bacterium]|nr:2-succinyl-5-enolpyruvyl-6-hydroxy-3-cyclohexene-1-carboxylic-acid synthase [Actinomycetota bacterium]
LAPAVHEAREGRVPMLVLTADRPPELRDVGAGQTIDQLKLYGGAVKWFMEVGTHTATPERLRWMRALACRAYLTALEGRPGPVHLNFALREPLVLDEPLPPDAGGRPGRAPWIARADRDPRPSPHALEQLVSDLEERPLGVIVCGRIEGDPALGAAAAGLAATAGYPVLADPLSGARSGEMAVAHYDALLRDRAFADGHAPELVLRVGDLPTSKPLRAWLAAMPGALQVALDAEAAWQDPDAVTARVVAGDPAATLAEATARLSRGADGGWVQAWRRANDSAHDAITATLADELSEPWTAAALGARLPPDATLFVASSMPVRDVETFVAARDDPPRVLGNRGANGIDGTVSAAFGAAAAGSGPVVLLIGDVALAHDIGGLLAASRLGLAITIVLLNNDGGGIFHFLPVAGETDAFEEHVATPHGLDFSHAAALYGCSHERIESTIAFGDALERSLSAERTTILEIRTDRADNVELHRRVWSAVEQALEAPYR